MTVSIDHPLEQRARYGDAAKSVLHTLERRLEAVWRSVERSSIWQTLTAHDTPTPVARAIIREVMFSVHQYQPLTTEAGFAMLGRLPKGEARLLMSLLSHKAEEAEHGLWATRDFTRLGGPDDRLEMELSPAAFAAVSVWDRMARVEEPFGYIGAEYLFECLTMLVAPRVTEVLSRRGLPLEQFGFVSEHAVEDIKHTNLIVHWILEMATRYPQSGAAMIRCFDYFASVYPLPVWGEAFERATASTDPGARSCG